MKGKIVTLAVALPDNWTGWDLKDWDWEGVINHDDFEDVMDEEILKTNREQRVGVILVGVSS